jgi:hypothetical protein
MTLKQECKAWTVLSVGALAIAGVFALLLVLSRTPYIQDFLPWPWKNFFHKGLVVHVIFSFVVWFLATMGALFSYRLATLFPASTPNRLGPFSIGLALLGCSGLILPALFDWGTAELNNYVPVMNHPTYYFGLICLFGTLALLSLRQLTCRDGTSFCAVLYLIACVCFVSAWQALPDGLAEPTFNEQLFWGGGHLLQFVNTALLILIWGAVVTYVYKQQLIPRPYEIAAFIILVLFGGSGPFIYLFFDVMGQENRDFFTALLRYGLPLPSLIASLFLIRFLLKHRNLNKDRLVESALWLSLITYNLGGLFGLFLDGTDTRVPAHYHAVIGGINLSFMIFYHRVILPFTGIYPAPGRLLTGQYWLYGLGQIMHASGMFLAGLQGVPRKTAGGAQSLDNLDKILSMGLMGLGGLIAVLGGVLFVITTLNWIVKGGRIHAKT